MSFIDQKPWTATEKDCKANWGGKAKGEKFRCYLCGYRFCPGDTVRWVKTKKHANVLVCVSHVTQGMKV